MRYTPWKVRVVPLAEEEIRALPPDLQARYLRLVDVIQDHGPGVLGMPHARQVEGKIWELRLKGRVGRDCSGPLCLRSFTRGGCSACLREEKPEDPASGD